MPQDGGLRMALGASNPSLLLSAQKELGAGTLEYEGQKDSSTGRSHDGHSEWRLLFTPTHAFFVQVGVHREQTKLRTQRAAAGAEAGLRPGPCTPLLRLPALSPHQLLELGAGMPLKGRRAALLLEALGMLCKVPRLEKQVGAA